MIVVEALLLHQAGRGRFFSRSLRPWPLGVCQAATASVAGNLVSIAVSVGGMAVVARVGA